MRKLLDGDDFGDVSRIREWEQQVMEMHASDFHNFAKGIAWGLTLTALGGILVWFTWWIL